MSSNLLPSLTTPSSIKAPPASAYAATSFNQAVRPLTFPLQLHLIPPASRSAVPKAVNHAVALQDAQPTQPLRRQASIDALTSLLPTRRRRRKGCYKSEEEIERRGCG
ncbi:hypothetical protein M0R45_008546 [Rubus argutus]|uniref:Uncharacterized protein n=1 Tax=Rubus argutus TaxID=59490 RepID=A0AAW1Y2C7_RUBAR